MPSVDINWWAVVVAALINMGAGFVWYSKALFAKDWTKATGKKMEDMDGGGAGYIFTTVAALVQGWVLAHFISYAGSNSFWEGMVTGFWIWLAFVAITMATNYMFESRPWRLWQINAGYFLVVLLINGGLLAAWR
jgi:hypothetical protein